MFFSPLSSSPRACLKHVTSHRSHPSQPLAPVPEPPKSQSFASQPSPSLALPQSSSSRFAAQSLPQPTSALSQPPVPPPLNPSPPSPRTPILPPHRLRRHRARRHPRPHHLRPPSAFTLPSAIAATALSFAPPSPPPPSPPPSPPPLPHLTLLMFQRLSTTIPPRPMQSIGSAAG
ncbi:MAG: hypothetical protein WDW36_006876 [Sanguina aurantia]